MKKVNGPFFGIGTDIESVDRFRKFTYDRRNEFLRRVYTPAELRYAFSRRKSAEHLAARFAAKEAIMKALSSMGKAQPAYRAIEIQRKRNGAPIAAVDGFPAHACIAISLSHTSEAAIAFALILYDD